MQYLVDTNVVLRAVDETEPLNKGILGALKVLKNRGDIPVVSTQVAAELWNVVTRRRDAVPAGYYGLTTAEAAEQLSDAEDIFQFLPDPSGLYALWRDIVIRYGIVGTQVHDARHVAWALGHNIDTVLTFNVKHFARFKEIRAISPLDIL